ncbi:2,4'-dihydroxyacetophenone dioxygenase family protein [Nevskia sp.]|uniref:2,4'-dihydroxyacetophenone dioxygenase family protein n=1 Tax=Nevskia sp. TaxID=1929292 RepID=UPI0025CFC917|nr:2,4'-dihydroxyacetophenone dioxygenase family protein [Nevskia sp.]
MALPPLVTNHKELLTLNTRELPLYENALPGIHLQPLMLDTHRGIWVLRVLFEAGVLLPLHYHTGAVHMWTLSGKWNYVEFPEQPQTAGSYLYEPGSSMHTFMTPKDNSEVTETLMHVEGSNVNFDADGNFVGFLDANSLTLLLDHLVRERGLKPARYIRPQQPDYTAAR